MKPKCFFRGCNHKMQTSITKRNFPSCSLRSQFTASQKLPLLFPNANQLLPAKWLPYLVFLDGLQATHLKKRQLNWYQTMIPSYGIISSEMPSLNKKLKFFI